MSAASDIIEQAIHNVFATPGVDTKMIETLFNRHMNPDRPDILTHDQHHLAYNMALVVEQTVPHTITGMRDLAYTLIVLGMELNASGYARVQTQTPDSPPGPVQPDTKNP